MEIKKAKKRGEKLVATLRIVAAMSMVLILPLNLFGCAGAPKSTETNPPNTATNPQISETGAKSEETSKTETEPNPPVSNDPFKDFKAVIRFTVGSDLQYGEGTGKSDLTREDYAKRLADFIDLSYKLHANDESYKGTDLIAMVGDLTANGTKDQYDECTAVTKEHIKDGTKYLVTMGNHEYYSGSSNSECVELFNQYYGEEHTFTKIGGYYFIGISCTREVFSKETLTQLDDMLYAASEEDKSGIRPIFVFTHQNPYDTVLGSQNDGWGWGTDGLHEVLEKYPQVVLFTGHSHFALEDPASFWQDTYSVFNTGTLSHLCKFNDNDKQITVTDNDKYFDLYGKYDYSAAYVVEVDAKGNIVVRGFDVLTGNYVGETYFLEAGERDYLYDERFEDSVIYFEEDAKLVVDNVTARSVTFTFDVCSTEGLLANNYMFEFYDSSGALKKTEYISYEYFIPEPNKVINVTVKGLTPDTEYTLKVYGINPLYKSTVTDENRKVSEPLVVSFTTQEA